MDAMVGQVTEPAKRKWYRTALKYVGYGLGIILICLVVAQLTFTYSGNRQWELVSDKQGIKVYSMKVPGQDLRKFKAVFTVKASLSTIVAFMQDNDSELDIDFYGARELDRHGPQAMVTQWKSKLPSPFKPRDFVVRHMFVQDPGTKEILYTLQSQPDAIPPESCCVRVPVMNNDWEIVPKGNGNVEIRWFIDMDVGGAMPYFLMNWLHPQVMTDFGSDLQGYLNRPKYTNAKLNWVVEPVS